MTYYWDVAGIDNPVLNPSAVDLWGPPDQKTNVIGLRSDVHSFVYQPPAPTPGAVRQLVRGGLPHAGPVRSEDGCTDSEADTPVFTWTAIPGATSYTVTVALDPNFTNVYRVYSTRLNRLAPRDSWRDNQANEAYYWNVTPDRLLRRSTSPTRLSSRSAPRGSAARCRPKGRNSPTTSRSSGRTTWTRT